MVPPPFPPAVLCWLRRYVVCKGLRQERAPVIEYLFQTNDRLNSFKPTSRTQHSIMPVLPAGVPALSVCNFA